MKKNFLHPTGHHHNKSETPYKYSSTHALVQFGTGDSSTVLVRKHIPQAVTHRSKGRKEETSTSRSYYAGPVARSKPFNRSTNNAVVMLVVSPWYVDKVVHV